MATATVRALKPTRSRVLTVVFFLAILFGFYGLLSAQQARSVTTLPKQLFTGVNGSTATLVHPRHVTGISHPATGSFIITFDRHVDNCSVIAGATQEPDHDVFISQDVRVFRQHLPNNQVDVQVGNPNAFSPVDGDFNVIALCPGT